MTMNAQTDRRGTNFFNMGTSKESDGSPDEKTVTTSFDLYTTKMVMMLYNVNAFFI